MRRIHALILVVIAAIPASAHAQEAAAATAKPAQAPASETQTGTPIDQQPVTPPTETARPSDGAPTAPAAVPVATLYMPDGQLKSHRLQVYVTRTLTAANKPKLKLYRNYSLTATVLNRIVDAADNIDREFEPIEIAAGQSWVEKAGDGTDLPRQGTILLFDASAMKFGGRAMVRVRPALSWQESGSEQHVFGLRDVNVADSVATVAWTSFIVLAALFVVVALAWRKSGQPMLLLTGVDGHLALSQAQVACWTIAVGAIVLGYGLIRLDIPSVPESLLVLMGSSLVTGGVAYFQDKKKNLVAPAAHRSWAWGDLVRNFDAGQAAGELSLAKAQMLFWTLLLLVLFVSKSLLEGRIWEIPWPLVAFMGFSQAGYLAPKLVPDGANPAPSPAGGGAGGGVPPAGGGAAGPAPGAGGAASGAAPPAQGVPSNPPSGTTTLWFACKDGMPQADVDAALQQIKALGAVDSVDFSKRPLGSITVKAAANVQEVTDLLTQLGFPFIVAT
jgi:hypothetical protein